MDNTNSQRLVAFQITDAEIEAIDLLAVEHDRSRSAEIRVAMRAWFKQHDVFVDLTAPKTRRRSGVNLEVST